MKKIFSALLAIAAAMFQLVRAEETMGLDISKPSFTIFHEMGRIEEGVSQILIPIESQWVHRSGAWINFKAKKNERLGLDMLLGGVYYTTTLEYGEPPTRVRYFAGSVPRFDVSYIFGNLEKPFMRLDAGIFQYKYNENVRNLGEYMFRSGVYPGWISTGGLTFVGVNNAQLTGLKLNQSLGMFSHDLIANLETEVFPLYDLSLTYLAKVNVHNVLKVGGGVQLTRVLPAVPSRTNPSRGARSNLYFKYDNQWYAEYKTYYDMKQIGYLNHNAAKSYFDTLSAPAYLTGRSDSAQRIGELQTSFQAAMGGDYQDFQQNEKARSLLSSVDSIRNANGGTLSLEQALDTLARINGVAVSSVSHYDASGIKPLAFFSFDPKPLLGLNIFGPNDLILYGETALLGIKNYPVFYNKIMNRIPFMVGFNVPTFKLLDVLSFELEHYGFQFPNHTTGVMNEGVPQPTIPQTSSGYYDSDWEKDNWKWSVFAQRRVIDGFTVSGQVARDNARGWEWPNGKTFYTIFQDPSDWYWMLKFTVNI